MHCFLIFATIRLVKHKKMNSQFSKNISTYSQNQQVYLGQVTHLLEMDVARLDNQTYILVKDERRTNEALLELMRIINKKNQKN